MALACGHVGANIYLLRIFMTQANTRRRDTRIDLSRNAAMKLRLKNA